MTLYAEDVERVPERRQIFITYAFLTIVLVPPLYAFYVGPIPEWQNVIPMLISPIVWFPVRSAMLGEGLLSAFQWNFSIRLTLEQVVLSALWERKKIMLEKILMASVVEHTGTTKSDSGQVLVETHFTHQVVTAAVRQSDVADEQIEVLHADFLDCLFCGMGYSNFVTAALQHPLHSDASVIMVIHEQDAPVS